VRETPGGALPGGKSSPLRTSVIRVSPIRVTSTPTRFSGFLLFGSGQVWADDFRFERVSANTPVTGKQMDTPRVPTNLDFES
jgi:hypothetical protein